ncbi:MAG TPA: protein kinase [Polyangia bacterium]
MSCCPRCGASMGAGVASCGRCGAPSEPGAPADSPFVGRSIAGKFILREVIGEGGMGAVFRADQVTLGRTVAVKLMSAKLARDESMVRRFMAEARAASRVNHPNTISIIDFGQTPDRLLYIVMEYVRGRTLTEVIRQDFPLAQPRLLDILCQMLAGLHEAHSQEVVHQDIKPDNILVERLRTGGDLVKIADFGIARLRGDEPEDGAVCGTPDYMAPEQIRGEAVDARTDVYAAGVLAYELLTGERPFSGGTAELLRAHLTQPVVAPRQRRPDVAISAEVEAIVLKALAKAPAERFASAAEFRHALDELFGATPVSGTTCRTCATPVPANAQFCPGCGARLGTPVPSAPRVDPRGQTVAAVPLHRAHTTECPGHFPLPFVGRAAELQALERMLSMRERAEAMVVLGSPGLGKSRLASEAATRASALGYRVLRFGADPSGVAATWYPVRAAVAALLELPPDLSRQALGRGLGNAGIALGNVPGLVDLFGLGAPVTGLELAVRRRECAAAALRVLRGVRSWPLTLLIFEDVDRYDRPSLDLLQRLVEFPGDVPVHVLLTSAPGGELDWIEGAEVLSLRGLPPEATAVIAPAVLGAERAAGVAGSLFAETEGVPLHLEQSLRQELEGGAAAGGSLADVIAARIESLPPQARWALQAAAVVGLVAPERSITKMLRGEADLGAALTTLTARGLVTRDSGTVAFAHPLFQELAYGSIPVDARRQFHLRLHTLLTTDGAAPALVGYHGYCAGGGARVLASLERAGIDSQRAFDDAGAVVHYGRAWELARWDLLGGEDEAEPVMARVGVLLGEAMRYAGDLGGAEGVLRETLESCGGRPAQAAAAWRALAHVAAAGGKDGQRARDLMQTALSHALRSGERGLMADIYLDLCTFLQREGDVHGAIAELSEGVLLVTGGEGAASLDGPPTTWRMLARLAELLLGRGQVAEALHHAEHALAHAQRVDSPVGAARTHALLGDVLAAAGRPREAAVHRIGAVEFMRSLGDRRSTAELLFTLASGDLAAGAAELARARLLEAQDLATALEWKDGITRSGRSLAAMP